MNTNKNIREMLCQMQYFAAKGALDTLYESGISYAVVKGGPLSYYKTGFPGERMSRDIDILVSRRDVNQLSEILAKNGFKSSYEMNRKERIMLVSHSHQLPSFCKNVGKLGVYIDVNFDLFWGEYTGERIDVLEFLDDTETLEIWGCKVKTLSPLKTLVQLVLHHYKEMNSLFVLTNRVAIQKRLFEDIYMMCRRYPDALSVDNVYKESLRYNVLPYMYYMFFFTKKIYDDAKLDVYINVLHSKEGENLLNCYGLTSQERRNWNISFEKRLEKNVTHIVLDGLTNEEKTKIEHNKEIFG